MALMQAFMSLYNRPAVNKAVRTFAQSFVGLFLTTLIPWLSSFVLWANGGNGAVFPDVNALAKAGMAAAGSAVIAVVTLLHNSVEQATGTKIL